MAHNAEKTVASPEVEGDAETPTPGMIAAIRNKRGLHARAAAKFVKLASQFDADVTVSRAGQEVSGVSIMGLMMLAAAPGTEIYLTATGVDAQSAIDALGQLVADKFGED